MAKTKAQITEVVAEVLAEIQASSGREPVAITGQTCPIGDLPDFDSLNGVEATVELADRLGVEIPGVNVFVNEKGTKALRVSEITDNICSGLPTQGS